MRWHGTCPAIFSRARIVATVPEAVRVSLLPIINPGYEDRRRYRLDACREATPISVVSEVSDLPFKVNLHNYLILL